MARQWNIVLVEDEEKTVSEPYHEQIHPRPDGATSISRLVFLIIQKGSVSSSVTFAKNATQQDAFLFLLPFAQPLSQTILLART